MSYAYMVPKRLPVCLSIGCAEQGSQTVYNNEPNRYVKVGDYCYEHGIAKLKEIEANR